ncbi:MAG: hypothetical protein ABJA74_15455 [Lapillicoccus sp.]
MVHALADEFGGEVAQLFSTTVTDREWTTFLGRHVPPVDTRTGQPLTLAPPTEWCRQ